MARHGEYAICPHCGYEHGDCWEWVKDRPRNTKCDGCGQTFSVYAEYDVVYITSAKLADIPEVKP